jgi:hypothetical protein
MVVTEIALEVVGEDLALVEEEVCCFIISIQLVL